MPCRLRREPLRAGAAFMRVNSLTSLLRKRCLLRPPHLHHRWKKRTRLLSGSFSFRGLSARRCRATCGVNPFGLTASEERSKRLHLRKSSATDIANDCAICRTNAQHCCLQQIVERRRSFMRYSGVPKRYFCTFGAYGRLLRWEFFYGIMRHCSLFFRTKYYVIASVAWQSPGRAPY